MGWVRQTRRLPQLALAAACIGAAALLEGRRRSRRERSRRQQRGSQGGAAADAKRPRALLAWLGDGDGAGEQEEADLRCEVRDGAPPPQQKGAAAGAASGAAVVVASAASAASASAAAARPAWVERLTPRAALERLGLTPAAASAAHAVRAPALLARLRALWVAPGSSALEHAGADAGAIPAVAPEPKWRRVEPELLREISGEWAKVSAGGKRRGWEGRGGEGGEGGSDVCGDQMWAAVGGFHLLGRPSSGKRTHVSSASLALLRDGGRYTTQDPRRCEPMEEFFQLFGVPRALRAGARLVRGMRIELLDGGEGGGGDDGGSDDDAGSRNAGNEDDEEEEPSADAALRVTQLCALRWLSVVEAFPLADGAAGRHRRRDLRRGGQSGVLARAARGVVRLELAWGEPLAGRAVDEIRLVRAAAAAAAPVDATGADGAGAAVAGGGGGAAVAAPAAPAAPARDELHITSTAVVGGREARFTWVCVRRS